MSRVIENCSRNGDNSGLARKLATKCDSVAIGSPTSNIIKSVKRSMAGEYSRELSTKVFAGQGRLIEKEPAHG